jgi:hypothetical protein
MRFQALLVFTAVLVAPIAARAEDPTQMRPGLWEISVSMEMPGMPFKMPPTVTQQCVSQQEAAEKGVPPQGKDCTVSDMKRSGKKISWKVTCTGQTPGKGEGEVVFSGPDAYSGKMKLETSGMLVNTAYTAKRLGACK